MLVLTAALVLAVVSLASNVTTTSQLAGDADALLAVRWTLSKLVNSGTVWAGLGILSGWLIGRPVRGALAGVVASLLALVAHYGLGRVTGVFGPDIWASNASWFVAAAVLGGPLGMVGAMARRADLWVSRRGWSCPWPRSWSRSSPGCSPSPPSRHGPTASPAPSADSFCWWPASRPVSTCFADARSPRRPRPDRRP